MDEIATPADDAPESAPPTGGSAKGPVRAYSPAVLGERQPRVIDFLPVRPLWVALALLVGLAGIAAIEALHVQVARLQLKGGTTHLAAVDVATRGSLATWYASVLLMAATGWSFIVFAIRAHRVDDYRGRYRVWLWTTAALAWLSLDAATGLHNVLGFAVSLAAGQQVLTANAASNHAITWLALYGLVLGALGIRLAIEVWPSLPSFAALLIAGLGYLCGGLAELGMLPTIAPLGAAATASTVALLAHLALAASIGFFARHVYLDATGRLKVHIDPDKKKGKPKRQRLKVVKEEKPEEAETPAVKPATAATQPKEAVKFGAPAANSAKSGATISSAPSNHDDYEDEDEDDDFDGEKLSKAERKRLKKMARQQNQRRAA